MRIIKLNTPTIKIGSSICKVGSIFDDSQTIYWSSPKQDLWAKYIEGDPNPKHYTPSVFKSRNVKTPAEYYHKTNHPSTLANIIEITPSKHKHRYPDSRIALVIGNSNYNYLSTLNNPINDATDVAEKLNELGFDVILLHDVILDDFETALKKISGSAIGYDVVLIYYSGHGIQYNGHNYLIPIDTKLDTPEDLYQCIFIEDIYSKLNRTGCASKLLFLDACRNEPAWKKKTEHFSEHDTPGIRVVFSTSPNAFAYGSNERNSPFAQSFLLNVVKPSSNVMSTISDISTSLKEITQKLGLPSQEVHDYGSSSIPFTFKEESANDNSIDISLLDISQIENLARNGECKAYIPAAKYYMKNAYGLPSYETAYEYAIKAWNSKTDLEEAKVIFNQLEKLGFFNINSNINPLKSK